MIKKLKIGKIFFFIFLFTLLFFLTDETKATGELCLFDSDCPTPCDHCSLFTCSTIFVGDVTGGCYCPCETWEKCCIPPDNRYCGRDWVCADPHGCEFGGIISKCVEGQCGAECDSDADCPASSWVCDGACQRRRTIYKCDYNCNCVFDRYEYEPADGMYHCEGGEFTIWGVCGYGNTTCDGVCGTVTPGLECDGANNCDERDPMEDRYENCNPGYTCSEGSCSPGNCKSTDYYCDTNAGGVCGGHKTVYDCDVSGSCSGTNSDDDSACNGLSCGQKSNPLCPEQTCTRYCDGSGGCGDCTPPLCPAECSTPADCPACYTCTGGSCVSQGTVADGNKCVDDCTRCLSGSCVNRSKCSSTECSGQERCNVAGGSCRDPDANSTVCTDCYSGTWDLVTSDCCGDDGASDNWCNSGGGSCVNGGWYTNHCSDGVQNCDEVGLDCGGVDCSACGVPPSAPIVTNSTGASNITNSAARLNGEVTDTGGENPTVHIYWGDNDGGTTPTSWDYDENLGTKGAGTFYKDISGLLPSTTYYYRSYASNSAGDDWANSTAPFTTQPEVPPSCNLNRIGNYTVDYECILEESSTHNFQNGDLTVATNGRIIMNSNSFLNLYNANLIFTGTGYLQMNLDSYIAFGPGYEIRLQGTGYITKSAGGTIIEKVAAVCTRANPTVSLSPSSRSGNPGDSALYAVFITNNDTPECGSSVFDLTRSCPPGWECTFNKYSLTISPGLTDSSTDLYVTSSPDATAGDYTVSVTATNNGAPSYSGIGSAIYTVTGPIFYLDDTFGSDTSGWSFWEVDGCTGYNLSWGSTYGYSGGGNLISGDGYGCNAGMKKTVNISGWSGIMYLEWYYRATSEYAGSSVTNFLLCIPNSTYSTDCTGAWVDPVNRCAYYCDCSCGICGGVTDTGWVYKGPIDISSAVSGRSSMTVCTRMRDAWSYPWNQRNYFDNFKLYTE